MPRRPGAGRCRGGRGRVGAAAAGCRASATSVRRTQPDPGLAVAGDDHLLAGRDSVDPLTELVPERIDADPSRFGRRRRSGAEGARTPDLRRATAALSQLSYSPVEVVRVRHVNACELAVARRGQPKIEAVTLSAETCGKQEAAVDPGAVDGEQVNFALGVGASYVPGGRAARSPERNADHRPVGGECAPFALDAQQPAGDLKRHVVAAVVGHRHQHRHT
jgi:hypothetical protein